MSFFRIMAAIIPALIFSLPVIAKDKGDRYKFVLTRGDGIEVCEEIIKAARVSYQGVVGVSISRDADYRNWSAIRGRLGDEFIVPDWKRRDLNNPAWREEAVFALAILNLRYGGTWASMSIPDYQIKGIVSKYVSSGVIPYDNSHDRHDELIVHDGLEFYQAAAVVGGVYQVVNRLSDRVVSECGGVRCEIESSTIQSIFPEVSDVGLVSIDKMDFFQYGGDMYFVSGVGSRMFFEKYNPYKVERSTSKVDTVLTCSLDVKVEG